jgi:hypothetical protein
MQKEYTEQEILEIAETQGYTKELFEKAKKVGHPINIEIPVTENEVNEINHRCEMLDFVGLETADYNARFIDIDYSKNIPGRTGRTCVVMGAHGLHARIIAEFEGKEWDEGKAMHLPVEKNLDMSMSCRRAHVYFVLTNKIKMDYEQAGVDRTKDMPEFTYELVIKYGDGCALTIKGLNKENAAIFKKMVWTWITFHNANIYANQG